MTQEAASVGRMYAFTKGARTDKDLEQKPRQLFRVTQQRKFVLSSKRGNGAGRSQTGEEILQARRAIEGSC